MSDRYSLATAAGATSIVGGMTLAIDNKEALMPAFLAGWGLVGYGITEGFSDPDPLTLLGLTGIVGGAMAARAPMDFGADEIYAKFGEPAFLAGWGALAAGMARRRGVPLTMTVIPALTIIGGAMMLRKNAFEDADIPEPIPALVFAAGWAMLTAVSTQYPNRDASMPMLNAYSPHVYEPRALR